MNFKVLGKSVMIKNVPTPRWVFTLLICLMGLSVAGVFLRVVWSYQQNNLDSLNNKIESLNNRISPNSVSIPKDQLTNRINALQEYIDTLKVEDDEKRQLSKQIIELKQEINTLPKTVVPSERLTLEKDLLALNQELVKEQNGVFATLLQAVSGLFLFLTVVLSALNFKATEDKQISERFSQSVELLSAEQKGIEVVLGGIYALERIAKDSAKDHWVVIEVLTSFVRKKASKNESLPVNLEVQSALTVIGRRDSWKEKEGQKLNLTNTSLIKVNLQKAELRNADFKGADLSEADFKGANLRGASFKDATLRNAIFEGADLEGASFKNATLRDANFINAINKPDFSEALEVKNAKF